MDKKAFNEIGLGRVRATIEALLGTGAKADKSSVVDYKRREENAPIKSVLNKAIHKFGQREDGSPDCDRVFIYNPDAIGSWIYEKYEEKFSEMLKRTDISEDMLSVFPPVTPVCFATMYSGLAPAEHGIQKYVKPVLEVDTIFDYLPTKGLRVAIVCTAGDSIAEIFKGRRVDYYIYDTVEGCNSKAMELIDQDIHDVIVLYNGNYDYYMHRFTPEGKRSLKALSENIDTFCKIFDAIEEKWKAHKTTLIFAPDHGCHRQIFPPGSHGKNIEKDMNVKHFYGFLCKNIEEQ